MQRICSSHGAALAALAFLFVASSSIAADPAEGTLSPATPELSYGSGPFLASNPTPVPEADTGPRCNVLASCDSYKLTVSLPAGYAAANPKAKIRITTAWEPAGGTDVDLWVYDGDQGDLDGSSGGIADGGASQNNPETVTLPLTADLTHIYTIKVVPFAATGVTATTTIVLEVPPADTDGDGVIDPNDLCPGTPAGTPVDATGCPISEETEVPLHFHGNTHETPDPCSGAGNSDFAVCSGPFLKESGDLDPDAPAARFDYNAVPGANGQGPYDANWTWQPASAVTVKGYTVVNFWASCNGECVLLGGTWDAYLYKNNTELVGSFEELEATPSTPNVPSLLSVNFRIPDPIALNGTTDTLTLKLEAHFSDTGSGSSIYYDSTQACPGASGEAACDSIVIFNAKAPVLPPPPPPPPPAAGLEPRYQIHVSPADLGNDAGEPSVGFNKFSGHTMFISYVNALRQTYQEDIDPPLLPASCPALWEDKSGTLTTVNSLDPILFTDEATGRTWNSQLSGDNSLMEYTDDDGENWTPAQKGPPNGGADHQAVASGVYPEGAVPPLASWPAEGAKRAVYYCSQSVAGAFCSRSDDGGDTFGPGFPFKNTDCAAGALHGHVKVAPDGTVYVPDSSQCVLPTGESATHVVAFASEDAGQTWSVRAVPFSSGGDGSDPSIGVATDGTLYMCYPNSDSTVHVAVSDDKGVTWTDAGDVGAAAGLVQTRFPQMIAGDQDRAACAFLGTTTAGNGSSLDFKGVWHGYVATTYDKGKTWHLVNVTPNDPVQGFGGVGPDGTNRNLLDFNDLQIDDQGRTYFAFADGCTGGCVRDPSKNSFAAKATIVRQTGGRTLFAAFDDDSGTASANERYNETTPIEPLAACARQDLSARTPAKATVVWSPPDNGGAAITNYKVYRSTSDAGPFDFLADAGPKNVYVDQAADPAVERYYYRIEAHNPVGIAPVSNTVELMVSTVGDPCTIPGQIVAADPTGDSGGSDDLDIVYAAVAEPKAYADSFVITLKVKNFTAGIPPATSFYVILFPLYNNLYLALDSTNGPARFVYGTFTTGPQGVLVYEEAGTLDERSTVAADGTITMVVPRSMFGTPAIDDIVSGFDVRARIGAASATSRDTAGPGDYTVQGIDVCVDPVGIVLATLNASLNQGTAPLEVMFTLSGTAAEGKTLESYSLDFGDGSPAETGAFAGGGMAQVAHTYGVGVYRARLTVTDSDGTASENLAEQTITVVQSSVPPGPESPGMGDNKVGALPLGSVLLLGLLGLVRVRRQRR